MELFKLLGTIAVDNSDAKKALKDTSSAAKQTADDLNDTGSSGEKSGGKLSTAFKKVGSGAVKVAKVVGAGMIAAGGAVAGLVTKSVQGYADFEQLVGGVETLFKDSANTVLQNANQAYKTAGLSANAYMETVTSFSASLLQSLGGDTAAAAEKADMAIVDMADNANKMGTSMEMIQNAYQGFAKQNYTMLDNLKLGYGGTKEEMGRLLADAQAISGIEYDISSYADVVDAIHVIQTEMGITGTTAKEASSTISGSIASMKSAWSNLMVAMSDENADFGSYVNNFVDSVATVADNLMPRISVALDGVVSLIDKLAPVIIGRVPELLAQILPNLISAATNIINELASILPSIISTIVAMIPRVVRGIRSVITALLEALPSMVQSIVEALPTLIRTIANSLEDLILSICEILPDIITPIIDALPDLILLLAGCLVDSLPGLIDGFIALFEGLVQALPQVIQSLVAALPELIDMLVYALTDNLPIVIDGVIQLVMGIVEALPQIITALTEAIPTVITMLVEAIQTNLPVLIEGAIQLMMGLVDALPQIIQALVDATPIIMAAIIDAVIALLPDLIQGTIQLIMALVQALPQIFTTLVDGVVGIFSGMWETIESYLAPVGEWINTNVIQPVISFFQSLWDGIKAVWDGICNAVSIAIQLIASILDAAFQIITLPFRFIWENCKEYVFAAFEWIKEKISGAVSWISEKVQAGFIWIKEHIIQPITDAKNKVVEIFNNIKSAISEKIQAAKEKVTEIFNSIKEKITTPINAAKTKVSEIFNNIKTSISEKIQSIKTKVTDTFNSIKEKMSAPIEKARDTIKGIVDKIKGFFSGMKISFPKIKLPHFSIKPSGWKIGDLLEGSIPKLGIDWYAKAMQNPMIMTKPTIFGYDAANGTLMGGGERGSEVVSGTGTLMSMIRGAVAEQNSAISYYLQRLIEILGQFFPQILEAAGHEIVLSDGTIVGRLAPMIDEELGKIKNRKDRGR